MGVGRVMAAKSKTPDVSVVIPTFRRPQWVGETILSIVRQTNALKLDFEIIVVDNSPEKSAEDLVSHMAAEHAVPIRYVSEPRQNIALARNAGIDRSRADFIAMIDDDERAAPDWLDQLVTAMRAFDADVIAGPTSPIYEADLPTWLPRDNRYFKRGDDLPTGSELTCCSSAHFLMRSATCLADGHRFEVESGRWDGSDTDFFMNLHQRMGCKIVWCNEASVVEFIPRCRITPRYLMRRHLRSSQTFVSCATKYSRHPFRTAAYLMFVVGCTQIATWIVPSLLLAPFRTPFAVRARINLMHGVGKLFWMRAFRFNFY